MKTKPQIPRNLPANLTRDEIHMAVSAQWGRSLMRKGWSDFEDVTKEAIDRGILRLESKFCRMFRNNHYTVQEIKPKPTVWGDLTRILIRRNDNQPAHEWTHLQWIKNELYGEHRVALECYPPQEHVFDCANIYHLWLMPENFYCPLVLKDEPFVFINGGAIV